MQQELQGFQYLKSNEIANKTCDVEKPFAFISYSHEAMDAQIVRNTFSKLYEKGYNLWIDTANIPYDENSWEDAATKALRKKGFCKCAIYFRSESSMTKAAVADELEKIKKLKHIGDIITVDIWNDANMSAGKYYEQMINSDKDAEYKVCERICSIVNRYNSAIRLVSDTNSNIDLLVEKIAEQLEKRGVHGNGSHSEKKENSVINEIVTVIVSDNTVIVPNNSSSSVQKFQESFVNFASRFKGISVTYKRNWKNGNNVGNTPPIPFSNMELHFPQNIVSNGKIAAESWKQLFNKMMDEFCLFTNGEYLEYRKNAEAKKNIKAPAVVSGADYREGKIACERYQAVLKGKYYFFNSYGAPELIKAMKDELTGYTNFLANHKEIEADINKVTIIYSLPVGEYADYFKE